MLPVRLYSSVAILVRRYRNARAEGATGASATRGSRRKSMLSMPRFCSRPAKPSAQCPRRRAPLLRGHPMRAAILGCRKAEWGCRARRRRPPAHRGRAPPRRQPARCRRSRRRSRQSSGRPRSRIRRRRPRWRLRGGGSGLIRPAVGASSRRQRAQRILALANG